MLRSSYLTCALSILLCAGCFPITNRTVTIDPQGEFATINNQPAIDTIKAICKNKQDVIQQVIANPEKHSPPVFYALGSVLFATGDKDNGMYWFFLGQLRACSDTKKSLDPSVFKTVVPALDQKFGGDIYAYAANHIPSLKKAVYRAAATDASLARSYDPRWCALSGMDGFTETKIRFKPKSEWKSTDNTVRKLYIQSFNDKMKSLEH